jgi:hypothetical protein
MCHVLTPVSSRFIHLPGQLATYLRRTWTWVYSELMAADAPLIMRVYVYRIDHHARVSLN